MGDKEKNFMSAVIYVHNAQDRIGGFLENVIRVMEDNFEKSEIICVNDFSEDGSISVIKKISQGAENASVSILNMSCFHGVETAMAAGVDLSIGDFVLEFDSAVQDYGNAEIMRVYHKSLEGYDIVSASPQCRQKLSSEVFYRLLNKAAGFRYEIQTERFRILSRRAINRIGSMNRAVPYRKAVYAGCGLPVFNLKYETAGMPRQWADKEEKEYRRGLAVDTLIIFTQAGYRGALAMTLLMMLTAVFMAVYSVAVYVTSIPAAGWMTTVLFLSAAFFGLFGILTVIIKYLQIIVDLIFRKKNYNFEGIEKLTR